MMKTIDVHISRIGRDRNGNLIGRFVATREGSLLADSGHRRRQIHGGFPEATRMWLASYGYRTDERAGGVFWSGSNGRGRVTDVRMGLREIL